MFALSEILTTLMTKAVVVSRTAEAGEPDLMAQWPVVGIGLQLLGLVADVFLVLRWRQRRSVGTKPWGLSALFTAIGVSAAVFLSVGTIGILLHLRVATSLALLAGAELVLFGVLLFCLRLEKIEWGAAFGLRESSASRALFMGVVFFIAIQPPLLALATVRDWIYHALHLKITTQDIVRMFMGADSAQLTVVLIGFAVLVAPVCEEVFFRGLAYPALKQRWGTPIAMAIVSVLFALIHLHVPSLPLLIALAAGLTLAYEYTGSLLTPIMMHALFNLLNVVAILLYRANP